MMFIHLEANQIRLHMNIDDCYIDGSIVVVSIYNFTDLWINRYFVQYLSCFDKGNCTLLIKDGEILKEKLD